jgi:Zn-dependent protease
MNPDKPQSSGKRILYLVLAALAGFVGAIVAAALFVPNMTKVELALGKTATKGLLYVVLGTGMILPAYLVLRRSGPMELAPTPMTGAPAPRTHGGESEAPLTDDARYEQAKQLLTADTPKNANSGVWFLILMLVFIFTQDKSGGLDELMILMVVLAFHEGGHYLAMRIFGYRDVRVFFIPLFGAATVGKPHEAKDWQKALVLMAGPMPGLLLALVLALVVDRPRSPMLLNFARQLAWLNAFNLLPLEFIDGGRFLRRVLFSRHHVVEIIFRYLTSLLLCIVAIAMESFVLGALGLFALITATSARRMGSNVKALRSRWESWPSSVEVADETLLRDLFREATELFTRTNVKNPTAQGFANVMRAMFDQSKPTRISVGATLGLVALYVFAFWSGVVAIDTAAGLGR